jgi:hypothetical protein
MSGEAKKKLRKLVCAGIVILALAGIDEARASMVEVTDVQIIRGELVGGWFQAIEEVDELIVGDVFVIITEVTNLGSQTEHVLSLYSWDLSPQNHVEVIGTPLACLTYYDLQPGESAVLSPFCSSQAFRAEETGLVTMNISVRDWSSSELCEYTFDFMVISEPAMIYYVDADANGVNDGSSWTDAYNCLQDALSAASSGDEIRVAQGIYKPDEGAGITPGDRTATFQLKNGVTLKGGYAGFGEPDPNARDIERYETILTGDLSADDVDVYDPIDLLYEPTRSENSYHVVTGSGTDANTVLDGFNVTAGNANIFPPPIPPSSPPCPQSQRLYNWNDSSPTLTNYALSENSVGQYGGGMSNRDNSNPTLINCTFSGNSAYKGGGLSNWDNSSPTLTYCTFSANSAYEGGGIYNEYGKPMLTNCKFSGNSAKYYGGGMSSFHSGPTLTNCTFSDNSSNSDGGGMYNLFSSPMLTNCTFSMNSANSDGGGMHNFYYSNPELTNCTFRGNLAKYEGGGMWNDRSNPTLTNCAFRGNSAGRRGGGMCNDSSDPNMANCAFTGNSASTGGGMYSEFYSSSTLTNCTFSSNSALNGSALACDSHDRSYPSNLRVINCILWDSENGVWNNDNSMITITYSDVQGGWPGEGNIDADPCFVDPGYWDTNSTPVPPPSPPGPPPGPPLAPISTSSYSWVEGDYHLLEDSPCIDSGDPNYVAEPNETDLDGRPRVVGGRIDMGAYEHSPPIPAEVRIVPRTINLTSKGKWITCYIWLTEEYNVVDIDPNSVLLEDEIEPESLKDDEDQQVAIAKFNRSAVQAILAPGEVELTVSGELKDGTIFEGIDIIRVIDKADKK